MARRIEITSRNESNLAPGDLGGTVSDRDPDPGYGRSAPFSLDWRCGYRGKCNQMIGANH